MPDPSVKQRSGPRRGRPRRASRAIATPDVVETPRHKPEGLASHTVLLGAVSAIALAACAKIGEDVIDDDSRAFDRAVRDWTLAHQRPRIRRAFSVATHAGAPSVVVPVALMASAWLWRAKRLPIAAAMVTAPAVAAGLFVAVKHMFKRDRPAGAKLTRHRTHSFPSGHATTSAAVLGAIAYVLWREKMLPATVAAALGIAPPVVIGASRVYLDVHWATDVLGGWSVGALVAMLGASVYERVRRDTRERGEPADG